MAAERFASSRRGEEGPQASQPMRRSRWGGTGRRGVRRGVKAGGGGSRSSKTAETREKEGWHPGDQKVGTILLCPDWV